MDADDLDMSSYRCHTCRAYFRRPEFQRAGLSCYCSAECLSDQRHPRQAKRKPDVTPEVRAAVHLRDNGRCRYCGDTAGPHQHHIAYRSQGGAHTEENLITLCGRHHDLVHSDKRRWQPILLAYIWIVYAEHRRVYLPVIERQFPTGPR